jgi:hypothetical protein
MNYSYERKYRDDLRAELARMKPNFMLTMNYRKPLSGGATARRQTVTKHFRQWNREVLKALYGRKFALRNQDDAVLSVAFIEVGPLLGKEHLHVLVRVPAELQERFRAKAAAVWQPMETAPATGNPKRSIESDVLIQDISDLEGAIRYCSKDVRADSDNIVFSSEFRNLVA